MAEYHNQSKLRFWCQMVLPLVYDDSLSYMELLNKVVTYLNNCIQDVGNCETNIESLLEAFVNLQDYVNEIGDNIDTIVEEKIDQMIESGEFGEILADALATVIAPEYDTTESYIPLNYAIYDGTLYCCTGNTTGEWNSTKWRETTVGDELNTLMQRVFALNAGEVSYSGSDTYPDNTVGKKLQNLSGNDIAYNPSTTYNNGTVGKELANLNTALTSIEGVFAYIENSVTVTRNYSLGDYIYIVPHGTLYVVVGTLNSGDTVSGSTIHSVNNGNAIKRNIFTVEGTLKSGITSTGNVFTQTSPSDNRITANTKIANVILDTQGYIASDILKVITGAGTVTIEGKTQAFSGTINVIVELYNG